MLNKIQFKMIERMLYSDVPLKLEELSTALGPTSRRLSYFIREVNDEFPELIENRRGHGYYIRSEQKQLARRILRSELESVYTVQDLDFRKVYVIVLLLSSQAEVSFQTIADLLYVSKTTASNDFSSVKMWLSLHQIPLIQNARGNKVLVTEDEKLFYIVRAILEHFSVPVQIDYFLNFFFGCDMQFNLILKEFRHFLTRNKIHVSDNDMFTFTLLLVISNTTNVSAEQMNSKGTYLGDDFQAFLLKYFSTDKLDTKRIKTLYDGLILQQFDQTTARFIVSEFLKISSVNYSLNWTDDGINLLIRIVSEIIFKAAIHQPSFTSLAQEIKLHYPLAYEIALTFTFLFEGQNIQITTEEIGCLALFINSMLVEDEPDCIDLIVVSSMNSLIDYQIRIGLERVLASHNVRILFLSLYEFYAGKENIDKSKSILIDLGSNLKNLAEEERYSYHHLNPLFLPEDIQRIITLVNNQKVIIRNTKKQKGFREIKNHIHYEKTGTQHLLEILRNPDFNHKIELDRGIIILQKSNSENGLTIFYNEKTDEAISCVIEYRVNPKEKQAFKSLLYVEEVLAKYLHYHDLISCTSDEAIDDLIETLIEHSL